MNLDRKLGDLQRDMRDMREELESAHEPLNRAKEIACDMTNKLADAKAITEKPKT
jgi:outer membrane murein-binding lipoprotein Lpp